MKLAVVGTGKIAHQVVSYLVEWGYEFAAIVSTPRSFAQATDLAQLTESTAFSSFEDALSGADFDTVYLTTPNNTHFSLAKTALEAGKNVIVEKPIASNFDEASELVRIARERKLLLVEAQHFINPTTRPLKKRFQGSARLGLCPRITVSTPVATKPFARGKIRVRLLWKLRAVH